MVVALLTAVAVLLAAAPADQGDPYRSQQWWLGAVAATAGEGQRIAIVDSGVDLDHPDLVARFARAATGEVLGVDLVDGGPPDDPSGHGTMVAGLAAATAANGVGIAGTAPGATILPVRVLDVDGVGTAARVAAGITWAIDHDATVINLSLEATLAGGTGLLDAPSVQTAVRAADAAGVNVVVAAGNRPDDESTSLPVILVGAHDREGRVLPTSGRGDEVLFAPGEGMVSTWCLGGAERCSEGRATYGVGTGTSFAAPVVAGLLARVRAAGLDADAAEQLLRTATVPTPDAVPGRRLATDDLVVPGAPEGVRPAAGPRIEQAPDVELPRDPGAALTLGVFGLLAGTVLAGVLRRRR